MDLRLPNLNTDAIQQGLRDVGGALAYQRRLQDQRDATQATLAVRSAFNDKLRDLRQSGDYSHDWGDLLRMEGGKILDAQAGTFKDAQAFTTFRDQQLYDLEGFVPALRKEQEVASQNHDREFLASTTSAAQEQAAQDLPGAAQTLNMAWGATFQTQDQKDKQEAIDEVNQIAPGVDGSALIRTVRFNAPAMNAYQKDGVRALKDYQGAVDSLAGTYLGTKIDSIIGGQDTAENKLIALVKLQGRAWSEIQASGLHVSQGSRGKLDDALQNAVATAKAAAVKEHKDQGMAELAATVSAMTPQWSTAKISGQGFDPTPALQGMLKDNTLDTDVREAVNTAVKNLTLEADKNLGKEKTDQMLKLNLDGIKNRIQVFLKQGANSDFLDAKIVEWTKAGSASGLDPRNYSEAVAFAKGAVGLESDPVIKGVMDAQFKDLPADAKTKMEVRFKELAGGLYNKGEPDAFKTNGRWDAGKLKAAASDMAEAEKKDALHQILTMNWATDKTVEYNELVAYVDRAATGKLIGQFDASNIATRVQPFTDALYSNLKTARGSYLPTEKPSVEFNLYTSAGLPTFRWSNGMQAIPSVKDGKVEWVVSTVGGRTQ